MQRKQFVQAMALLPFTGVAMQLSHLHRITEGLPATEKMPVLFLGHGSPMNAIEDNEFARGWQNIGKTIPAPRAILCISAHWETAGTFVTAMEKPRTIHDFGGFPPELFAVQYPAPGSLELAYETKSQVTGTTVELDQSWGLDHGCWSVVKHLYPKADIPVVQLSLDYRKDPAYHYSLAGELAGLRRKGILIIGSGNMVHNLRIIDWRQPQSGFDWAVEANQIFRKHIDEKNHIALSHYSTLGKSIQMAIPTPEHYLPLLYTLALQEKEDRITYFNDKTIMGSISMTSVMLA